MNLSKTYDCLSHDLLIVKLEADGLDIDSLHFLLDYLSFRNHRTKISSSYSKWSEICRGIPQGSSSRLVFNIFINDNLFFVEKSEILLMMVLYIHVQMIFLKLKKIRHVLWFRLNSLRANPRKFQFTNLGDKTCYEHISKNNVLCVQTSDDVTLLGVIIYKSLTVKQHIDNLVCKIQY